MTTTLDGPLKRALVVEGEPYTLTITPEGLNLAPKGHRKGYALAWRDLVSGEAALATALNASLASGPAARARPAPQGSATAPARGGEQAPGGARNAPSGKRSPGPAAAGAAPATKAVAAPASASRGTRKGR